MTPDARVQEIRERRARSGLCTCPGPGPCEECTTPANEWCECCANDHHQEFWITADVDILLSALDERETLLGRLVEALDHAVMCLKALANGSEPQVVFDIPKYEIVLTDARRVLEKQG